MRRARLVLLLMKGSASLRSGREESKGFERERCTFCVGLVPLWTCQLQETGFSCLVLNPVSWSHGITTLLIHLGFCLLIKHSKKFPQILILTGPEILVIKGQTWGLLIDRAHFIVCLCVTDWRPDEGAQCGGSRKNQQETVQRDLPRCCAKSHVCSV